MGQPAQHLARRVLLFKDTFFKEQAGREHGTHAAHLSDASPGTHLPRKAQGGHLCWGTGRPCAWPARAAGPKEKCRNMHERNRLQL